MSFRPRNIKNIRIDNDICILDTLLFEIGQNEVHDDFEYLGHLVPNDGRYNGLSFLYNEHQYLVVREEDVYGDGQTQVSYTEPKSIKDRDVRALARLFSKIDEVNLDRNIISEGAFRFDGVSDKNEIVIMYEGSAFLIFLD